MVVAGLTVGAGNVLGFFKLHGGAAIPTAGTCG